MKPVQRLKPGSVVGMIAPSGPAAVKDLVQEGARYIEAMGFVPRIGPGCYEKLGFMAGTDEVRLRDLHDFFAAPDVDGIFCMKGGDSAPHLLDRLDFDLISRNPKVFVGYSDITALHIAINQRAGFMTFHGPMPVSDMLHPLFSEFERDNLLQALTSPLPAGLMQCPPGASPMQALFPGCAEGRLTGGNLSLVSALMGTPYEIDTRDKILILEDVDEENYRIDRMLTQLRLAEKLEQAAAIVLGRFTETEPADANKKYPVIEVFRALLPQDKPVLMNVSFGHQRGRKTTLPLGAMARVDGDRCTLTLLESGVI